MAPQVSRSEFLWSSLVVIVKPEDTLREEVAGENAATGTQQSASTWNLVRENKSLKRTLEECLKREDAIRDVFVVNHEKEQELSVKTLQLKTEEIELMERELRLETEKLESKEQEARLILGKRRLDEGISAQSVAKSADRIRVREDVLVKCLERRGAILEAFTKSQEK
ncbi:hypothetical protein N0V90_007051 [Kalmusia sp. IMI 367209]|nr:hypothetical protein N0V90_007051 [Kalmusia sp. IMI 367209]